MRKWMERALDPNTPTTKDNETVRTASSKYKGKEILYPTIRLVDGKLKKLSDKEAKQYALVHKDYIEFVSPNQAEAWSKSFSNLIDSNRKDTMPITQQAAGELLRRNAPPGEFPAFINSREASWLRGMGGKGKKTKSGLRSFQGRTDQEGGQAAGYQGNTAAKATPDFLPGGGHVVSGAAQDAEHARVAAMGLAGGGVSSDGSGGIPGISGGHDTRTPQGPGSVTNPNDPYGVQKKIAEGAGALIDKEYVAPTLTPEERIAQTSAETLQARQGVQDMQGTGQEAFGQAADVGKRISGQEIDPISGQSFLTGQGVDQYMSPHTKNVIGGMQENAMRTMQKQRGALQAQHQMAGAGMGSRGALENAAMMGEVQRNLGQQVSGALEGSYAQAADMKRGDMDMEQQRQRYNQMAAGEEGRLQLAGAAEQRAGTAAGRGAAAADINMLSGVGADVEGRSQNVLDEQMGDFYEERDWGENKLASAANIAGTMPSGSTTTTTGAPQHKKKDKFGRIISGAASGWLASGGNPYGAVAGGLGGAFS